MCNSIVKTGAEMEYNLVMTENLSKENSGSSTKETV